MKQSLLADRFKLKSHFETREMPVYDLVIAKGGPKLKENPEPGKAMVAVGASMIRGTAIPLHNLLEGLESVPDLGGRMIIDKTELSTVILPDRKSTRLNSSHYGLSRMPSSA